MVRIPGYCSRFILIVKECATAGKRPQMIDTTRISPTSCPASRWNADRNSATLATGVTVMSKATPPEFIESTAGQVAAELARRGVAPDQRVVVTIEPDDWITE